MTDAVYLNPRVIVEEVSSPVANIVGIGVLPPARVALVGPGVGYQSHTETVTLTATTPVTLAKQGIDTASIAVRSLAGVEYAETTDWVSAATGSNEDSVTTLARTSGGTIGSGDTVYVSYEYADDAYYLPFLASDLEDIQERYGNAFDTTTGAINSPLSLAAKIALEQGTRDLVLVPTKGSTNTAVTVEQLTAALALLESRSDVGMVVPLPVGLAGTDASPGQTTNVATALEVHINACANAGNFRRGVIGFDIVADRSAASIAALFTNQRIDTVWPGAMEFYNGYSRATIELGGMYLAAAVAGLMAALDPSTPLTRKPIRSFSAIPARIKATATTDNLNAIAASGVTIIDSEVDNRLFVRHGISTDMTNVLTREISIVRAKDAQSSFIRRAIERSGIVGTAADGDVSATVQGMMTSLLDQCVRLSLVSSYANLTVRPDGDDPTVIRVRYSYIPIYPINQISVQYTINTVTGSIQEA